MDQRVLFPLQKKPVILFNANAENKFSASESPSLSAFQEEKGMYRKFQKIVEKVWGWKKINKKISGCLQPHSPVDKNS